MDSKLYNNEEARKYCGQNKMDWKEIVGIFNIPKTGEGGKYTKGDLDSFMSKYFFMTIRKTVLKQRREEKYKRN